MSTHEIKSRGGRAVPLVSEFLFVAGVLFASMLASVVILGSLNPLESPFMAGTFAVVAVIGLVHHFWYQRHRPELETSREHHADRERRGF